MKALLLRRSLGRFGGRLRARLEREREREESPLYRQAKLVTSALNHEFRLATIHGLLVVPVEAEEEGGEREKCVSVVNYCNCDSFLQVF